MSAPQLVASRTKPKHIRIPEVTRNTIGAAKWPRWSKADWDAIEANPTVQMWLAQLERADAKVEEIKANVDQYVDLLDAFDAHKVCLPLDTRKERALAQFAHGPRKRVWCRVLAAFDAARLEKVA